LRWLSNTNHFVTYYDLSSFSTSGIQQIKGLMVEASATNLVKDSYFSGTFSTYWRRIGVTETVGSSTDVTSNIYGAAQVAKLISPAESKGIRTAVASKISFSNTVQYTVSAYLRGSGTAKAAIYFQVDGGSFQTGTPITLQNDFWEYHTYTFTADRTGSGNIGIVQSGAGDLICYVSAIQVEASPYATSFIPTTTAALTRPAEVLKYENAGNRTAAAESIFIKLAVNWVASQETANRSLLSADTKRRYLYFGYTTDFFIFRPNRDDSINCKVENITGPVAKNTSYTIGLVNQHSNPYAAAYLNGTTNGTNEATDDYVDNEWGTYFYIGSNNLGEEFFNGIIQSVAIYNRALSAGEVSTATNTMNE
jgi:hypothetical protein